MPTRNQSGKPSHVFQNPERKRQKSGKKYENLIKWYRTLLKREEKEGATKRILKTKERAEARIKRYGVTEAMIQGTSI